MPENRIIGSINRNDKLAEHIIIRFSTDVQLNLSARCFPLPCNVLSSPDSPPVAGVVGGWWGWEGAIQNVRAREN